MSIQKAPPPIPAIHFHWARFQFGHSGPICIYSNSSMRLPPWRHFSNYMHPHQGSDFPWIDIEYMFSTHLNWQLTWRWKSFLAQQYAASIAVIVSGAENVEWALDEGCRAYPMMVDIPYMIQVPGTPPRSPCVLHVSFTPYTSIAYFAQDDWLWHAPVILSPSNVWWGVWDGPMGRVHTMPLSRPYTGRAPILSGETKPLWTRPSGHGGHAQMWGAVSFDQSSTPESRGPRYFQGVLDIGSKQRRWEWWYNSSMTVEKGDLNLNLKTNLECIRDTLGTSNLKLPICGNTDRLIL